MISETNTPSVHVDDAPGRRIATPTPDWASAPLSELPIFWGKSNFYRTIVVDGVFGGPSPTPGRIAIGIFSHHLPYPEVSVNDPAGNEIMNKRVTKYGVERELEASLSVDLNTARSMIDWLQNAIKMAETAMSAAEKHVADLQKEAGKKTL